MISWKQFCLPTQKNNQEKRFDSVLVSPERFSRVVRSTPVAITRDTDDWEHDEEEFYNDAEECYFTDNHRIGFTSICIERKNEFSILIMRTFTKNPVTGVLDYDEITDDDVIIDGLTVADDDGEELFGINLIKLMPSYWF